MKRRRFSERVPNILTAARIPLSAALLLTDFPSPAFYALYCLCVLTDVLDGFLARRLGAVSVLGARLDSAADLVLTGALLVRVLPVAGLTPPLVLCVGGVVFLRLTAAIAARVRFGKFGFLHTLLNKATGVLLFLYPFAVRLPAAPYIVCAAALLSSAEEAAIELTAAEWEPDRRSIFVRK